MYDLYAVMCVCVCTCVCLCMSEYVHGILCVCDCVYLNLHVLLQAASVLVGFKDYLSIIKSYWEIPEPICVSKQLFWLEQSFAFVLTLISLGFSLPHA